MKIVDFFKKMFSRNKTPLVSRTIDTLDEAEFRHILRKRQERRIINCVKVKFMGNELSFSSIYYMLRTKNPKGEPALNRFDMSIPVGFKLSNANRFIAVFKI